MKNTNIKNFICLIIAVMFFAGCKKSSSDLAELSEVFTYDIIASIEIESQAKTSNEQTTKSAETIMCSQTDLLQTEHTSEPVTNTSTKSASNTAKSTSKPATTAPMQTIISDVHKPKTSAPEQPSPFIMKDPVFNSSMNDADVHGIKILKEYSNIVVFTDTKQYSKDVETIECIIRNYNIDTGFYFYSIPYIEHLRDGKWVRLNYQPPELFLEPGWAFCGNEFITERPMSTAVYFHPQFLIEDEFAAGDYRLVIFIGDIFLHAPFKIVE